jgi:hypothetical protein
MGFVDGSQQGFAAVPGFNDFFRRGFELTHLSAKPGQVKDLLLGFRDGRFRQYVSP